MFRFVLIMVSFALPAHAEPVPLSDLSKYLNALTTAQTDFVQYNSDGSRSRGTLHIQRPGRMKFEYAPPNEALVLANANTVAIFDGKSNAEAQKFPLKRTPLNLILGRSIDLADSSMVSGHSETPDGLTVVTARDPKNPDVGSIELYFTSEPVALTQWVITDEGGNRTGIDLGPLDQSVSYPNWYFSINREETLRAN